MSTAVVSCSTTSPRNPPVPRHPGRRFHSSSTTKDYRTPIGSRSRWRYRGDVRDALDRTIPTILGTGNGPSAFSPRNFALLGRHLDQHRQTNRLYRRMRIGAAQRELSRSNGEQFLTPGFGYVSHADWLRRYCNIVLLNVAHFWYEGDDGLWWFGKISATTPTTDGVFDSIFGRSWADQASSFSGALHDFDEICTTFLVSANQIDLASAFARGIQRIVDESRGAAVDS